MLGRTRFIMLYCTVPNAGQKQVSIQFRRDFSNRGKTQRGPVEKDQHEGNEMQIRFHSILQQQSCRGSLGVVKFRATTAPPALELAITPSVHISVVMHYMKKAQNSSKRPHPTARGVFVINRKKKEKKRKQEMCCLLSFVHLIVMLGRSFLLKTLTWNSYIPSSAPTNNICPSSLHAIPAVSCGSGRDVKGGLRADSRGTYPLDCISNKVLAWFACSRRRTSVSTAERRFS